MRDRAQRAIAECRLIAGFTEEPGRTTRRFLTPPVHQVHAHLRARMEALGMTVRVDAAGNLRGVWQPEDAAGKRLILGSHIDTVPDAGAFDGVLGVTLALEWVEIAQEIGLQRPIEVIAFSEEEGVRFGVPFLGSRAVAGVFDTAMLGLTDAAGRTLEQSIRDYGLDPAGIPAAQIDPDVLGFIEMHIEQGPVLDVENLALAVVEGIAGQTRLQLCFTGHSNHAGTAPMHLRRDALAAAVEWMAEVERVAQSTDGLVATVGKIAAEPNAANVIAGRVTVSLDVRHVEDEVRSGCLQELRKAAGAVAARRGIELDVTEKMNQRSVYMDDGMSARLLRAMEAAGFQAKTIPSGAGHDAMVMAGRVPTTMLFLRSPGGISHHPAESVREEDVEAALLVGREFLKELQAEVG